MSCRVRSAAECEQTANMTAPTTQQTRPTAPATEKRVRNESQHRLHAPPQERRAPAAADDDELQLQQPAAADAIDEDCKWCTEPSVLLLTNFYDKQCKKLQIQISPNFYDGPPQGTVGKSELRSSEIGLGSSPLSRGRRKSTFELLESPRPRTVNLHLGLHSDLA